MGWCSGTEIFDAVADVVIHNKKIPENVQKNILETLVDSLESQDWDCQPDSDYYNEPMVRDIFEERGHFYDDDSEDE